MPRGKAGAQQQQAANGAETLREVREKTCALCFAKTDRRCDKCKQVWFCSDVCLKKGWFLLGHKSDCGLDIPRPELPPLPAEFQPDSVENPVVADSDWRQLREAEVPAVRPRGFYNIGNTCYLNSALQCLAAVPSFSEYFKSQEMTEGEQGSTHGPACPSQEQPCFRCDLGSVFAKCQPVNVESNGEAASERYIMGDWVTLKNVPDLPQLNGCEGVVMSEPPAGQSEPYSIRLAGSSYAQRLPLKCLTRCLPPADPREVVRWLPRLGESFTFGAQEDAHEFARSVLRALGDEQMRELSRKTSEPLVGPKATATELTSIPSRVFGGVLVSQCACPDASCGHAAHGFEVFQDLSLEITEMTDTIEEMLQLFTAPERLDKNNKWNCEGCSKQVRARKRLLIHKSPSSLVLHLKRFRMGFHGKINKPIKFDTSLNLRPFMSSSAAAGEVPVYDLRAVIVHLDKQNIAFSGHYVAFVKYPDPKVPAKWQWYLLDDERCLPVSETEVLQQTAYLLFYTIAPSSKKTTSNSTTSSKTKVNGSATPSATSSAAAPNGAAESSSGATQRCSAENGCPFFAVPGQELCSKCYRERYNAEPPRPKQEQANSADSVPAQKPASKEERAPQPQQPKAEAKAPEKSKKKIGPNEPCPCGSGLKYKKCHGASS